MGDGALRLEPSERVAALVVGCESQLAPPSPSAGKLLLAEQALHSRVDLAVN